MKTPRNMVLTSFETKRLAKSETIGYLGGQFPGVFVRMNGEDIYLREGQCVACEGEYIELKNPFSRTGSATIVQDAPVNFTGNHSIASRRYFPTIRSLAGVESVDGSSLGLTEFYRATLFFTETVPTSIDLEMSVACKVISLDEADLGAFSASELIRNIKPSFVDGIEHFSIGGELRIISLPDFAALEDAGKLLAYQDRMTTVTLEPGRPILVARLHGGSLQVNFEAFDLPYVSAEDV
ncbi:hypothetical protein [Pseudophaeobacter flagellatus]|uniref:hypothetical protein n=1 Tax=Pseudophaeobacter flagellatus TaxID=2899119 RepID=UPI001E28A273|nr:hypothetical protein [Pseudophaeobacter flagellatus]MCD9147869.1 hypothetical protein [Pseudophaeobacter flagellatus]